jgi:hypothetical protein
MRLIDADALKEEIGSWGINDYEPADFIDAIDNAPSVSLPDFKEGYKQAIIDGKTNFAPCYQTTSCLDCRMYDKENHHCPRFCEIIRDLVKEVKDETDN